MNAQIQSSLPADAIIVSEIEIPKTKSVMREVRSIISRFYDQPFTYKHVYACALKSPAICNRTGLKDTVRWSVFRMARDGEIALMKRGGRGVCSFYQNHEKKS